MPNNGSAVNGFPLNIIHPIHEHTSGSLSAFAHALALAYASRGAIEIVDIREKNETSEPLSVRNVLEKWGLLPPNSERRDVQKIGLSVTKIIKKGEARKVVSGRMEKHPHDLLVIGTHERHGLGVLFGQDLAEYLADAFRQTTLYVPARAKPFVDPDTGRVTLDKILIPVPDAEFGGAAFSCCRKLLAIFPDAHPEIIGLHCGESFPAIADDLLAGLTMRAVLSQEPVVPAIVSAARGNSADLIIMATEGRNTLSKKVVGSNTEHVLHESMCPVLSVPVR
jgi:nucleotide-binding universal stress UspA family protein